MKQINEFIISMKNSKKGAVYGSLTSLSKENLNQLKKN